VSEISLHLWRMPHKISWRCLSMHPFKNHGLPFLIEIHVFRVRSNSLRPAYVCNATDLRRMYRIWPLGRLKKMVHTSGKTLSGHKQSLGATTRRKSARISLRKGKRFEKLLDCTNDTRAIYSHAMIESTNVPCFSQPVEKTSSLRSYVLLPRQRET
jgi:hypothetical protein